MTRVGNLIPLILFSSAGHHELHAGQQMLSPHSPTKGVVFLKLLSLLSQWYKQKIPFGIGEKAKQNASQTKRVSVQYSI